MKFKYNKKIFTLVILFICIFLGSSILIKNNSDSVYYKNIDLDIDDNEKLTSSSGIYIEFSLKDIFLSKYSKYNNLFTIYFNNTQILNDKDLDVVMDKFINISNEQDKKDSTDNSSSEVNIDINKENIIYLNCRYDMDESRLFLKIYLSRYVLEKNTKSSFIIGSNIKNLKILDLKQVPVSLVEDENQYNDNIDKYLKLVLYYIDEMHMSYKNIFLSKIYLDKLVSCVIDSHKDIFIVFDKLDLYKIRITLHMKLKDVIDDLSFEALRQIQLENYAISIKIYEELLSFYKKISSLESILIHQNLEDIRRSI